MKGPTIDVPARARPVSGPGARRGGAFYLGLASSLLLLNLVGFAPTYFFKGWFGAPALPPRTHVHGVLFTAWFVLYLVQSALVARGSVTLHRRLGAAGGVLAAVMTVSGFAMLHTRALEVELSGERAALSLQGTATVVWGNLALLVAFATFVALGIRSRGRPEAHRRLMALASVSMMPQSIGRIGKALPGSEVAWAFCGLFALLGILALHDRIALRRLHPVNLWGAPLFFAVILVFGAVLPHTGVGRALIVALAS